MHALRNLEKRQESKKARNTAEDGGKMDQMAQSHGHVSMNRVHKARRQQRRAWRAIHLPKL